MDDITILRSTDDKLTILLCRLSIRSRVGIEYDDEVMLSTSLLIWSNRDIFMILCTSIIDKSLDDTSPAPN